MGIAPTILLALKSDLLLKVVAGNLNSRGCEVLKIQTATELEAALCELMPRVLLTDSELLMSLSDAVLEELRKQANGGGLGLLIVTGSSDEKKHAGTLPFLKILEKPVSPERIVKSVLRALDVHAGLEDSAETDEGVGPIRIDVARQMVFFEKQAGITEIIDLGPAEFKLLQFLIRHPDKVFYRSEIVRGIWGRESVQEDRTIDVYVRRLRQALEPFGIDSSIKTIRGIGYSFLASNFHHYALAAQVSLQTRNDTPN